MAIVRSGHRSLFIRDAYLEQIAGRLMDYAANSKSRSGRNLPQESTDFVSRLGIETGSG
jgi:hypothetical protein